MKNLDIIKEYQDKVWQEKNIEQIDNYFVEQAMIHSPIASTRGIEELKSILMQWHSGFPNLKVIWDDFICDNDKVVSRWHAEGNHENEFMGIEASEKFVTYKGVTIYQLENNKISQYWAFLDMSHILSQIKN